MLIGVPKEIKNNENRVSLLPSNVRELQEHGHQIIVERNAGIGVGYTDEDYIKNGATVKPDGESIFAEAEMIVKVKEPQKQEWQQLSKEQILFTYLHLAPDVDQTRGLMESQCTAVAYETITHPAGGLPLLAPMSEVAGRMAAYVGAHYLSKPHGGIGVLLGGIAGVAPAKVTVLGCGISGSNAVAMLVGMGADVTVLDTDIEKLRTIDRTYQGRVKTQFSTSQNIEENVSKSMLVVGTVLIPGSTTPKLVNREMLDSMQKGSVVVDVTVDQGGCFETTKPTTHENPTYVVNDVLHYCVANMPGAYPRTSSIALSNQTTPYVLKIANLGVKKALLENPHFLNGLNVCEGRICHKAVAEAHQLPYTDPARALQDM